MAIKKAKVQKHTAFQELIGWSDGKPAITKADPSETKEAGATFEVDDGVITSSAKPPKQYYWVKDTKYYVKKDDVKLE